MENPMFDHVERHADNMCGCGCTNADTASGPVAELKICAELCEHRINVGDRLWPDEVGVAVGEFCEVLM